MTQEARAHLTRESEELAEAVSVGSVFSRDRILAEQKFSEAVKSFAEAKDEVRAQREYTQSLEGHCETMAQDNRRVEDVART